jgi:hypothetical protein
VALAACEHFERGPGMNSMMAVLLSAGIGFLLAGLLAIGFGVPVKEFSFGNTLMLMGAVSACTGVIRSLDRGPAAQGYCAAAGTRFSLGITRGSRERRAAQPGARKWRFLVQPRSAGIRR